MTRMTKRLRDQLTDIERARRKKAGKRTYNDAELAAVRAVTARLKEGMEPARVGFDPAILQQMITQLSASWAKQMQMQISRASHFNGLISARINAPRRAGMSTVQISGTRPPPGMLILDDIVDDDPLTHVDTADAFRHASFPIIIDHGAHFGMDFGVIQMNVAT